MALLKCGPSEAQVRTFRKRLKETLAKTAADLAHDPHFFDRFPPHSDPPAPGLFENPGHAAIQRLNWERRIKRLKDDWYGRKK